MSHLYLPPTREHAEFTRANGLTRYSYDEIVTAAQAVQDAYADYLATVAKADAIVTAHYGEGYNVIKHGEIAEHISDLYASYTGEVSNVPVPAGSSKNSRETYPVSRWLNEARTIRARIRKIERELARVA